MTFGRKILIFSFLLLPVLLITAYSFFQTRRQLINKVYEDRRTLTSLSAAMLNAKLDHLSDVGLAISTRTVFRSLVNDQKWNAAIELLQEVPQHFPFISQVFIADTSGKIMAAVPQSTNFINTNEAGKDWYKGIRKNWQPYLSGVYKIESKKHIVTALALPIKNNTNGVSGILILEVSVSNMLAWSNDINVGKSGFVYIVDQKGHIAVNPDYAGSDSIIDYSPVPAVQKALQGQSGTEVLYNPFAKEERLSSYQQLPRYKWSVIVQQQATTALFISNSLRTFLFFYAFIILLAVIFAWLIIKEITRRKKTEEQLSAYANMVDNTHVLIRGIDDKIKFWNKGMEELYGWTKEEVVGKNAHQLFATQFVQPLFEMKEQLLSYNQWVGELKHTRKDGTVIHVFSHWYLHRDENGNPGAIIETNNNITALKQTEEKLKNSEERFRLLIDNVKDYAIFMLDTEGRIITWNNGGTHIKGYTEQEVVGKSLNIFYTKKEVENGEPQYNLEMAKEYGHFETEGWRLRKDGTQFWANVVFTALKDDAGILYGFSKVTRDITESRKVQEEKEFLFRLINRSSDSIYTLDAGHKVKTWNRGAENLYGYTEEEMAGKEPNSILQTVITEEQTNIILEEIAHKHYWTGEIKRKTKAGEYIWIKSSSTTILDNEGNITGYVSVGFDISDRKKAEHALTKLNEELEIKIAERTEAINRSEKQYRYLFENNPIPMWIIDLQTFRFLDVNEMAIVRYGYSRKDFLSMTALDIRPDEEKEAFKKADHSFKANATDYNKGIWNHRKKDGTIIQVEVIAHSILFKGVQARLILSNDVTEQKKAEKRLTSSEERFRTLIENNYDIITLMDASFNIIYRSPSTYRITGWKNEEMISEGGTKNMHPGDIEYFHGIVNKIMAQPDTPVQVSFRSRHKNGNYLWLEGTLTNLLHQENIKAIVFNAKDVTERIEGEEKLKASEEQFRHSMDNMLEGVQIHDFDWKYVYVNNALAKYSKSTKEELLGYSLLEKYPGIEKTELFRIMKKCMTEKVTEHFETEFVFPDGSKTDFELSIQPMPEGLFILSIDITERKKAEEKLAASELQFRSLIENSSEGITLSDESSNITYRSPSSAKIAGGLCQDNIFSCIHPQDEAVMKKIMDTVLNQPAIPISFQARFMHAEGHYYWLEGMLTNMLHVKGVNAIVSNYHDITHRKELEDLLHKANKLARIGGWEIDILKETVYWSDITRDIHETGEHYIPDLATGINFYKGETAKELMIKKVKAAMELGTAWDVELQIVTAKNNERWVRSIGEAEFINGKCVRIYGSFQDIDQRKKAEEKLKASEEQFRNSMDNMLEGVQIVGFDWKYIYVNEALCRQGKNSKKELIGYTMMEKYPGIEHTELFKSCQQCFTERVSIHMENEFLFPDGSKQWFELSLQPVPEGIFILSMDTTERKNAENKILNLNTELEHKVNQRTEELKKTNEELEAFSYSVSHDLRAPLRAIIGFSAILEEDYATQLDDEAKRITGIIKSNTSKMGNLIDDLLTFSRMGRHDLLKISIDTNQMVNEVKEMLDKQHNNNKVSWHIQQLPEISGDISTIRQVWINLLSNAFKYSGTNPSAEIEVGAYNQNDQVVFYVKDNGVGFDEKYKNKLFKVFQRLHSADEFEGTGIGLAIVDKIVNKHGGHVWAEGEINKGATFYFSVPVINK